MENYPSYSYPDSGDSSPRSREIDFENPPPSWEDQPPSHHLTKVKFMVSYGGKIQPRSHDNLLSYVGGETKILTVDRTVKFSSLLSKLSSILSPHDFAASDGFTFKYQLPGEELDALISVTNDDDLENMMHEYDRLYRGSVKPARLRLFLFPNFKSGSFGSTSSDPGGKIAVDSDRDRDRLVEGLNSGFTNSGLTTQPAIVQPPPPLTLAPPVVAPVQQPVPVHGNNNSNNNNVDYLFGLEKSNPVHVPVQMPVPVQDPQVDARVQELNRMQISGQKNDVVDHGVFAGGAPASIPASVQIPAGYWQPPPQVNVEQPPPPQQQQQQMPPQHQLHHQQFHPQNHHQLQQPPHQPQQQHVYMMHAPQQPASMMHAPQQMMRPNQGYYQVHPHPQLHHQQQQQQQQPPPPQQQQQQPMYRDQHQPPPPPQQQQQQQQPQHVYNMGPGKMGGYSEGMGVPVRPMPGMSPENQGYTQVAYDSGSGRQVYYAAQQQQGGGGGGGGGGSGGTTPFQGGVPVNGSGEMRTMAAEAKVVQKVGPTSSNPV